MADPPSFSRLPHLGESYRHTGFTGRSWRLRSCSDRAKVKELLGAGGCVQAPAS